MSTTSTKARKRVRFPESYAELRALVAERLEQACKALPSHEWQWDETLDLEDMAKADTDRARRLLFGWMHDVIREYEDEYSDSALAPRRGEIVKRELSRIVDEDLSDLIEKYAERQDIDAADLAQDLKDDPELEPVFLSVPYVDINFSYRGNVAVVAKTDLHVGFAPCDDLLLALLVLRIPHGAYLQACQDMIDKRAFSFDDPGCFDDTVLQGRGEEDFPTLFDAYRDAFESAVRTSPDAGLYIAAGTGGSPAVDPGQLVEAMRQWDDKVELYFHTSCSGTTVRSVSEVLADEMVDRDVTHLVAVEGELTCDHDPDDIGVSVRIADSLSLPVSSFDVSASRPIKVHAELSLSEDMRYGALLKSSMSKLRDVPSMFDGEASVVSLFRSADMVPAFRASEVASSLPVLPDPMATEAVKARLVERHEAKVSPKELSIALFRCLSPSSAKTASRRDHALWLIEKGADVNAHLANGVTPLMLAARLQEPAIVSSLLKAGAEPNRLATDDLTGKADNALSIAARPLLRYQNVLAATACVAELLKEGAVLPRSELRTDRLDQDAQLAAPIHFAVSTGNAGLVRSTLALHKTGTAPIPQSLLDTALYRCGVDKDFEVGCALIEAGAAPDGMMQTDAGEALTVMDALRATEIKYRGTPDRAEQFMAMLRAHLARQAIARVTAGLRLAAGSSPNSKM